MYDDDGMMVHGMKVLMYVGKVDIIICMHAVK